MNRTLGRRERAQVCYDEGAARAAAGAWEAAAADFEKAASLHPGFAAAHLALAKSHRNLGRWPEAERSARAALEADPHFAEAAHYLGALLVELDRLPEALPFLQAAADWAPDVAQHQRDLGVTQLFLGDVSGARKRLLRTIELDVHANEVLYTLIRMLRMDDGSAEAERLFETVVELCNTSLPEAERIQLLFAMAKAREDRGEHALAAEALELANAMKRQTVTFHAAAAEVRMRRLAQVFDRALLERLDGCGAPSERPIFIVGMPRSGSTLVEQILSAHPDVHGAGEVFHLPGILAASQGAGGAPYPEWAPGMNTVDCVAIAGAYLDLLPTGLPGQSRTTDKWLENFENIGLIRLCLPNARIIHCHRDPADQLFSCWSLLFSQNQEYAYDLCELRRYHRAYQGLMAHWRAVLRDGAMLEVRYEALVADPQASAQAIIAHCGLEWDDQVLRFWEAKRAVKSASMAQVREPIYDRSIGRWRAFAELLPQLFEGLAEADAS